MRSSASSASAFKKHRKPQQLQQQNDDMRTFGLLQEEKKRLLDSFDRLRNKQPATTTTRTTTNEAGEKIQQQQHEHEQLRQKMNDVNRRQHAVLQRISAHDRYKRKKTLIYKAAATNTSARTSKPAIEAKTADLAIDTHTQSDDQDDADDEEGVPKKLKEIARQVHQVQQPVQATRPSRADLIADMAKEARIARQKMAAFDTHLDQCLEMAELLASGRFDSSDDDDDDDDDLEWKKLKKEIKQSNKDLADGDNRLFEATTATAAATSQQRPADTCEDSECERQLNKTMEEHQRYLDWSANYPLIFRRRANQSANAG